MQPDGSNAQHSPAELGHVVVPCGPSAPSMARAAVGTWLDGRVPLDVIDDARLLVSELVSNSFVHADAIAGAPIDIKAGMADGTVAVAVSDEGVGAAVAMRPATWRSGGFGLNLLDRVASRWGVTNRHGTQVWFELSAQPSA